MSEPRDEDVQATFVTTLVDEWCRAGMRHAVLCPGSRSTPLALALADHPDMRVQIHHDERSAGFMALGLGLASGRAAAVLTTSGTAAAELLPSVVEAHHAGVPLLVCTADRPPELQDVGAPQTIDQTHLFGRALRWFADPGVADDAAASHWRALASRSLAETAGPPPGPVHLNLPFREPLVGTPGVLPPARQRAPWTVAPRSLRSATLSMHDLTGRRGIIVAGEGSGHGPGDAAGVTELARALGWPVVADPRSHSWSPGRLTVAHLDGILHSEQARSRLRPEVILRLGTPLASRVVTEWCSASGAEEIVVSHVGWSDPTGTATQVVRADPAAVVRNLLSDTRRPATTRSESGARRPNAWLDLWTAASAAAAEALRSRLAGLPAVNEPTAARELVARLPADAWLVVSSSMPIRDVERYAQPRPGLRIVANRGANGIDGVVSTAVGVAIATGTPTGLLVGDLAFLHDSNGLLGVAGRGIDLVCVVVDNDGGGIFSFLPQARTLPPSRFEQLLGTPHGLDLTDMARAYGVVARAIGDDGAADLAKAIDAALEQGGVHVLLVHTDRAINVDIHRELDAAIAGAVDDVLRELTG